MFRLGHSTPFVNHSPHLLSELDFLVTLPHFYDPLLLPAIGSTTALVTAPTRPLWPYHSKAMLFTPSPITNRPGQSNSLASLCGGQDYLLTPCSLGEQHPLSGAMHWGKQSQRKWSKSVSTMVPVSPTDTHLLSQLEPKDYSYGLWVTGAAAFPDAASRYLPLESWPTTVPKKGLLSNKVSKSYQSLICPQRENLTHKNSIWKGKHCIIINDKHLLTTDCF